MKTEVINVTPQMASDWLKSNTNNRPLRRTVVNGIKSALQRGEYIPTHQGIAFDSYGTLMDGQHRLTAISELRDGNFPMVVAFGVDQAAFKVMDIGIKRSASDALGIDRRTVEVARLFAVMLDTKKGSITPTQLMPIITHIEGAHSDLLAFCSTGVKGWSSAAVRAAAVISVLKGIDRDYVHAIYRALVLSDFAAMPPVSHALVRAVTNGNARAGNHYDMFSRCMVVFDPKNAKLSRIQIMDTGRYIDVVRELFSSEMYFGTSEDTKKKAAPKSAAKSVLQSNYRTDRAV